ncbi:MAG: hypothetical protein J0L81_04415 [Caulobacterales bacterium]|jgi:hypothetical protein|nr:hypothetical protein [Caulobacterales bacterium]
MGWRVLFALAALYNLAVGGAMLAAPGALAPQLSVEGAGAPFALMMSGLLMFGVGYAMTARDPAGNRGIVWIGMIGKIGAAALGTIQYQAGIVQFSTFALGMGDLVFVALFALFLWRGPRLTR